MSETSNSVRLRRFAQDGEGRLVGHEKGAFTLVEDHEAICENLVKSRDMLRQARVLMMLKDACEELRRLNKFKKQASMTGLKRDQRRSRALIISLAMEL